jgi:hypothetical protein
MVRQPVNRLSHQPRSELNKRTYHDYAVTPFFLSKPYGAHDRSFPALVAATACPNLRVYGLPLYTSLETHHPSPQNTNSSESQQWMPLAPRTIGTSNGSRHHPKPTADQAWRLTLACPVNGLGFIMTGTWSGNQTSQKPASTFFIHRV